MFNLNCEDWWQNNSLEDWYKYAWQDPYPLLEDNPQPHQENDYYHQQWLQDHLIRHGIISSSYSNPINTWVMSAINNPYVYRLEDILKNALPVYDTQFLFDLVTNPIMVIMHKSRFIGFINAKLMRSLNTTTTTMTGM